jgi:hypothetical protein
MIVGSAQPSQPDLIEVVQGAHREAAAFGQLTHLQQHEPSFIVRRHARGGVELRP